ncbi:hypothetical protein [Streptomyces triticirhizae]|uniref:Uncharacterized protein n=1 Tax=Streptomyces triticirhizae TaxID=2483353 RepID=A0A3M2M5F2_9ACTN|nr:hypothetical protein [Streptomyces triticirhizae]RMI44984.1 hypothetical protein EBN88_04100 [Streptomyces triticirhizae]
MGERVVFAAGRVADALAAYGGARGVAVRPWVVSLRAGPDASLTGHVASTGHWLRVYRRRLRGATRRRAAAAPQLERLVGALVAYRAASLALVIVRRPPLVCHLWVTPDGERVVAHFEGVDRRLVGEATGRSPGQD